MLTYQKQVIVRQFAHDQRLNPSVILSELMEQPKQHATAEPSQQQAEINGMSYGHSCCKNSLSAEPNQVISSKDPELHQQSNLLAEQATLMIQSIDSLQQIRLASITRMRS